MSTRSASLFSIVAFASLSITGCEAFPEDLTDWVETATVAPDWSGGAETASGTSTTTQPVETIDDPIVDSTTPPDSTSVTATGDTSDTLDEDSSADSTSSGDNNQDTSDESTGESDASVQLWISEFVVDPEGKDGDSSSPEWVEIYNPGPDAVALASLQFTANGISGVDAARLGLSEITLQSEETLLIEHYVPAAELPAQFPVATANGWRAAFVSSASFRNSGGYVAVDMSGALLDVVVYGDAAGASDELLASWNQPPLAKPASGASSCRTDAGSEQWGECVPTLSSWPNEALEAIDATASDEVEVTTDSGTTTLSGCGQLAERR